MPRFRFWTSPGEAISWAFQTAPTEGDELVLDNGLYRVLGVRRVRMPGAFRAEYDVGFVRPATRDEARHAALTLDLLWRAGA